MDTVRVVEVTQPIGFNGQDYGFAACVETAETFLVPGSMRIMDPQPGMRMTVETTYDPGQKYGRLLRAVKPAASKKRDVTPELLDELEQAIDDLDDASDRMTNLLNRLRKETAA